MVSHWMCRCLAVLLLLPGGLAGQERPDRVVLFIGDGVGVSAWTAARFASKEPLAITRFRVLGLVDTRASDSEVTESAASATAYSAGVRTYNGAIGMGPDTTPVRTVLQVARGRGWSTGLVATSSVTHATPAAFAAHVRARSMEFDIARHIVDNRVDVLLGGGLRFFAGATRPDTVDLVARLRATHTVVTTAEEFVRIEPASTRRIAGLFAPEGMPPAEDRQPTLPDMTRLALDVLARHAPGFFIMIEGSQPDWRAHDNAPLELVTAEVLEFDRAIGVALDYQARHPSTLVLVLADHETGGMALQFGWVDGQRRIVARYTTTGHTAQMVPLFAAGPGAERFAGVLDNDRVGQILMELVQPHEAGNRGIRDPS